MTLRNGPALPSWLTKLNAQRFDGVANALRAAYQPIDTPLDERLHALLIRLDAAEQTDASVPGTREGFKRGWLPLPSGR